MVRLFFSILLLFLASIAPLQARENNGLMLEILVNGIPLREYYQDGTTYIEALRGKEYSIRVTNRLGTRAAVALSVDGLNTIDARHADAYDSRKWVLDPYQSIVISGWQTDLQKARRFYFTSEEDSYAKRLGQTANLGVISAVLFQEKSIWKEITSDSPVPFSSNPRGSAGAPGSTQAARDSSSKSSRSEQSDRRPETLSSEASIHDDWAATGMGDRFQHRVHSVQMDLERLPVSSIDIRYEFRPVLVKLGILPSVPRWEPLQRRQQAKGFKDSGFCPEVR